ncbi:hypothetical protein B0H19DRAFT_1322279 [Mycena capillaripes]|nr:hypothetical protein B0H19DRAFT_1322279 [Mycena capillaripes]
MDVDIDIEGKAAPPVYEYTESGECEVVPEGVTYGVKGSGMEEEDGEVDVVSGGVATDPTRKDRVRGKTRRRKSKREVVPESVCSPKMRQRWKADVPAPATSSETNAPSPGNARESARINARSTQTSAYLLHHCVSSSRRPHHLNALAPHSRHHRPPEYLQDPRLTWASRSSAQSHRTPALAARVRLSFPLARRNENEQERVEGPNVDAYASKEDDSREDILLLIIGEESYRPSLASRSPVPEWEEEDELPIAPSFLSEEEAASVPAEHHPVPAPTKQAEFTATLPPPSPAWDNGSAISLSSEAPPAAPLVPERVAGTRGMRRSEAGTSRVEGRSSMQPGPISLTRSAFITCTSFRLFFTGANPPSAPPPPPVPAYLLCTSFRGIRWRCYLFFGVLSFRLRPTIFPPVSVISCIKQCMFVVSSYQFGVKSAC